jgi:hypothetical protein
MVIDDWIREAMWRRMRKEEARSWHSWRTHLPTSEITMAVLPSGNAYPQWKGALADIPCVAAGND